MFQQFQEKISDEQLALELITEKGFSQNLLQADLKQFVKFIENQKKTIHLSSSIVIAIYSLILLSSYKLSFNQKVAIQSLSKLYRDSSLSLQYKQIISALLIRIPNFNNYRLIVKTMTPKYIKHTQLSRQVCQTIRKQASKQFQHVWEKYKNQWYCSSQLQSFDETKRVFSQPQLYYSRNFLEQFKFSKAKIQQVLSYCERDSIQSTNILKITSLNNQISSQFEYLRKRAQNISNEQLDLQAIFQIFTFIKDINIKNINTSLTGNFASILTISIIKIKQMSLKVLNALLCRIRRKFLKCLKGLNNFIQSGLIEAANNQYCHLGCYLGMLNNYIKIFGIGSLDWKNILFLQEYSLEKLLETLCNTNFIKQQKQQINFQKNKNKNKQKPKVQYKLNIDSHLRKGHYQIYLSFSNNLILTNYSLQQRQRQKILAATLDIFCLFYSSSSHYKAANIIHILQNAKNRLREPSVTLKNNLSKIIYRPNVQFKPGFQYFCEDILSKKIKLFESLQQQKQRMILESESNKQQNEVLPYKTKTNKSSSQAPTPIRKTVSYELQGWDNELGSNNNLNNSRDPNMIKSFTNKSDPSEMFYSIKQCSMKQQNEIKLIESKQDPGQPNLKISKAESFESFTQIKNKNQQNDEDDGFVLTPQF